MNDKLKTISETQRIFARETVVQIGERPYPLSFRIDGRGAKYRVDVAKPLFPIWEAIDGGDGFSTLGDALEHVDAWIKAAESQCSLSPRMPR